MRKLRSVGFGLIALLSASFAFSYVNYGPVKRGDTLWGIAMKHRPSSKTNVFEMIKAIKILNPTAFRGADDNILRAGVSLKLPVTTQEIHQAVFPANGVAGEAIPKAPAEKAPSAATKTAQTPTATPPPSAPAQTKPTIEVTHQNQALSHQVSEQASTQLTGAAPAYESTQTQVQTVTPVVTQTPTASVSTQSQSTPTATTPSHSVWSYVWFVIILGLLGYIFYNRKRLFASFQNGNDLAARRLGLNRAEPTVQAYNTETLWQEKKPTYAKRHAPGAGEGEAMADAMIEMAEGRYADAKQTLTTAVKEDPHNLELRMKLLDVYVALNDSDAYKTESDYILEHMITENDPRWNRIRSAYLRKWAYDHS